jgi:hypothetical protein
VRKLGGKAVETDGNMFGENNTQRRYQSFVPQYTQNNGITVGKYKNPPLSFTPPEILSLSTPVSHSISV